MLVKISDIKIGDRFRKDLGDISSLAKSIKKLGLLLHPIVVKKLPNGKYLLVCGERRLAVAVNNNETEIEAQVTDIPASSYNEVVWPLV